jgi:hypothetical protein
VSGPGFRGHARSVLRRIIQQQRRARYKRLDRRDERRGWPQWFILIGRDPDGPDGIPNPAALQPIWPPPDRFWADPFVWQHEQQTCLFVEECYRSDGVGHISRLMLGEDLQPIGPAERVLREDRHLSYPFVFAYQGALFMVPESAASGRVDLYRCLRFPDEWVRETSLLTDIIAADATLFEHEGRWWLMCAARHGRVRMNESLFAFYADSPLTDRWTPHPLNPLVRDFSGARPAGRILRDRAGRLLRPSQDCVPRYGYGLTLNVVERLTPEDFKERRLWHATGVSVGGWRAMHHLDRHDDLLVMDAQRLIP